MLTFPRRPIVEFYLDQWRDVSTDIRQNPAISITHGRKDWATKTSPSLCRFTLDDGPEHGDGDYDPNNPLGTWYGTLGRNTPVRMALAVADDTFARTVVDGWGTADTGDVWTTGFGAGGSVLGSDWQVAGGVGTQSQPVAAGYRYSVLDVIARDVEIAATITVPITNITGAAIEPGNLMVRRNAGLYYMARVAINSAEVLTISIHHSVDGQLIAPVTVPGLVDPVTPKVIRVKLQADGPMIRAKVYAPGAEPLGWHVAVHDTRITVAGAVGVRNGVESGNTNVKPVVFSVDDVQVRLPRFAGETSKMVPLSTVDHADYRTQVECASIRRRLAKGEKTLDTAFYRYITRGGLPFNVTEFWPLDYESQVDRPGRNVLGDSDARFVRSTGGALKWGTDTGLLQVKRAVTLVPPDTGTSGQMFADIDATPFSAASGYGAVWMQRLGSDGQGAAILDLTNGEMVLFFEPGIARLEWWPDVGANVVVMNVGMPQVGDDTVWHVIGLGGFQSGGTATFDMSIDTFTFQVNLGATTIGVPDGIQWAALPQATDGYQVTNAVIIDESIYSSSLGVFNITRLRDALHGHPFEHAQERFTRLCTEEGVPPAIIDTGTAGATPAMGPQRPLTLLTLTQECVDVDQGAAFDPKGAPGLGMRTHRATTTRDPILTLEYIGQVAPDFGPTTDDQGTLNDVTAKRPAGGEFRIEQATGPVNTADPGTNADAAGRYDTTVTMNVGSDLNLPDQAGWRVHLGTVDGPRYPTVTVDLAAEDVHEDPDMVAVLDVGIDDTIVVTGAQARRIHDDVRLIVRGYTETVDTAYQHKIVFNTTPYEPYNVGVYGDADARRDTAGSVLAAGITSSAASFTVTVSKGELWTVVAGQFPLDIWIGGERIRISAISGASSPQTFTVAGGGRAINGVAKAHSAGAPVRLFDPVYHGH